MLEESDLAELSLEDGDVRITLRKADQRPRLAAEPPVARKGLPRRADDGADNSVIRVEAPMVGVFYRALLAELAAVRPGGRARRGRPDALHPRGDEAVQRAQVGPRRHRQAHRWCATRDPVEYGQLLFELV